MKLIDIKIYSLKIMIFLIGIFIIQIGVGLFIQSNMGVDSFTILMQGIANTINITVGQSNILLMAIIFVGILCFAREYIRLGTFLGVFAPGIFLDLVNLFLMNIGIETLPFIVRLLILSLGCVIIAIGFAILNSAHLSVSPFDQLPLIIVDKTRFSYSQVRITIDLTAITIGSLLGGVIGLGTVIALLLIGPCIQYTLIRIGQPIERKIILLKNGLN